MSPASDLSDTLARYERFLAADPDNTDLLRQASDLALRTGDPAQARLHLERARSLAPDDPALLAQLGLMELSQNNPAAANAIHQELLERGLDAPALRHNLAYGLSLVGRFAEAAEVLRDAAAMESAVPGITSLRIRALHFEGQVEQAIEEARQHLETHADDAQVLGQLSTLLIDRGDYEGARAAAAAAESVAPGHPDALVTLGSLALAEQEDGEAERVFAQAVAGNPRSGRGWAGRGMAALLRRDLGMAEQMFGEALRNMPGHIGTWHALAWTQICNKDPAAAQASLERSMELDRNFSETFGGLAVVALMRGQLGEARELIRRALGLNPQSISGRFAQSLLMQARNRPEVARKIMDGILSAAVLPFGKTIGQAIVQYQQKEGGTSSGSQH